MVTRLLAKPIFRPHGYPADIRQIAAKKNRRSPQKAEIWILPAASVVACDEADLDEAGLVELELLLRLLPSRPDCPYSSGPVKLS